MRCRIRHNILLNGLCRNKPFAPYGHSNDFHSKNLLSRHCLGRRAGFHGPTGHGRYPLTGTVTLACSNGASYAVYIGDGTNLVGAGAGDLQMANGAARLPYQLYKEMASTNICDATGGTTAIDGAGGVDGTDSGGNQTLTVYGNFAGGTTLPSTTDNYSASIVVIIA